MEANGKCIFFSFNFNEDCWLVSLLMIDNLIGLLSISILSSSGWFLVKSKNILELFVCEYWELGLVLVLSLTITQILLISAQSPLISSRCAACALLQQFYSLQRSAGPVETLNSFHWLKIVLCHHIFGCLADLCP